MNRRIFFTLLGITILSVMATVLYFFKKFFNFDLSTPFQLSRYGKKKKDLSHKYIVSGEELNNSVVYSRIYESRNGTPEQNMAKVLEMLGGIEKIIEKNDIIVIKPNGQQISHNMTNTNTIKGFIDQVFTIPGFSGEIIIAENHHYHPANSAGWTTMFKNGDYNLNELVAYYKDKGLTNVTKYHWRDGGKTPNYDNNKTKRGRVVFGPDEGDGYVWTDKEYDYNGKKTKMSYPIFTSAFSGVTVDFKNGAWRDGRYTGQPVKFINISAIRNHSNAGVTATIKNYLGIIDMTCGYRGIKPEGYYNFHYIAVDWPAIGILRNRMQSFITSKFAKKQKLIKKITGYVGPQNGALGGAVGHFMKAIRMADLNIISAEYAGHEGRHRQPAHTKTVLASIDPVALDYYAGKYILYPLGGRRAGFNNPDNPKGTFCKYLDSCQAQGVGTLNEAEMVIHKFNFTNGGR